MVAAHSGVVGQRHKRVHTYKISSVGHATERIRSIRCVASEIVRGHVVSFVVGWCNLRGRKIKRTTLFEVVVLDLGRVKHLHLVVP